MPDRTGLDANDAAVLEHLLDEAFAALDTGDIDHVHACLGEARHLAADDVEVLYLDAQVRWLESGSVAARDPLERAIAADPDHADAHHALARVLEDAGDRQGMIAHDLEVLRLDARDDARAGVGLPEHLHAIEQEAERVLSRVPEQFRERLRNVPVVLEPRPSPAVVAEGFDPRALGLFEGTDDRGQQTGELSTQPSRIVLFYANLLASFHDDDELFEQIEVTLLHELGHFFGLDEDAVEKLGLA